MREFENLDAVRQEPDDVDSALRQLERHLPDRVFEAVSGIAAGTYGHVVHERGVRRRELLEVVVPEFGVLGQKVRIFVWSTQAQRFSPGSLESRFLLVCRKWSCSLAMRNRYEALNEREWELIGARLGMLSAKLKGGALVE